MKHSSASLLLWISMTSVFHGLSDLIYDRAFAHLALLRCKIDAPSACCGVFDLEDTVL